MKNTKPIRRNSLRENGFYDEKSSIEMNILADEKKSYQSNQNYDEIGIRRMNKPAIKVKGSKNECNNVRVFIIIYIFVQS